MESLLPVSYTHLDVYKRQGPIYRYDVDIAKNYLNEKELIELNRIVTMYLDYAELQAENHNAMTMKAVSYTHLFLLLESLILFRFG